VAIDGLTPLRGQVVDYTYYFIAFVILYLAVGVAAVGVMLYARYQDLRQVRRGFWAASRHTRPLPERLAAAVPTPPPLAAARRCRPSHRDRRGWPATGR
jgi:hypothetical protein